MGRFVIYSLHQTLLGPENPGGRDGVNCSHWPHCNIVVSVFCVINALHGDLTTSPWPYQVPLWAYPLVIVGSFLSPVLFSYNSA
jgi:hypothetical protein